jgi:oligopeptide/dipeptide ABC transporter ATP-binding protein
MTLAPPLVEAIKLRKNFSVSSGGWVRKAPGVVQAVADVSFEIRRGETLALVGESGCGKSTLARLLIRLIDATAGIVRFDGVDLNGLDASALRQSRTNFQLIFQDAASSFNPRMRVENIVAEPLRIMGVKAAERRERAAAMLKLVGISDHQMGRFSHEFSGGQRQRIGIARALVFKPKFVVCDEPVSALDVSIQAQVINLLSDLQKDLGLTYLFVSHDLRVVRHIANRVAVMYLGEIVEIAPVESLYSEPKHPYTQALLASVPRRRSGTEPPRVPIGGEMPSARNPPGGCRFHTRCPIAQPICQKEHPSLRPMDDDWSVACHFA